MLAFKTYLVRLVSSIRTTVKVNIINVKFQIPVYPSLKKYVSVPLTRLHVNKIMRPSRPKLLSLTN